jgi:hypothetical protein
MPAIGFGNAHVAAPTKTDANVVPQGFAIAGICIYIPPIPGSNRLGSEKPSIDSTFA